MNTARRHPLGLIAQACFAAVVLLLLGGVALGSAPGPGAEPLMLTWIARSEGIAEPTIRALARDPILANRLYAETERGTYRSEDWGSSWTQIQDAESCGTRGTDIAIATHDNRQIYIADYCEGVIVTKDDGTTWNAMNNGLPGTWNLEAVEIAQQRPTPFSLEPAYRGEPFYGGGIYASVDGAESWTLLGLQNQLVYEIVLHPRAPGVMFAGTNDGVYKSVDGGISWAAAATNVPDDVLTIAVDPRDTDIMYAGAWSRNVWKSVDGGRTWRETGGGWKGADAISALAVAGIAPYNVYAATTQSVYVSPDGGGHWVDLKPPTYRFTSLILDSQLNTFRLYVGGEGAYGPGLYVGLMRRQFVPLTLTR